MTLITVVAGGIRVHGHSLGTQLVARHRTLVAEKQSLSAELDTVVAEKNALADEAFKAKEALRLLRVRAVHGLAPAKQLALLPQPPCRLCV